MTDLAKLVVKLEAQTGQYQAQLERATGQLQRFEKSSNQLLGRLGGILAGVSFAALIKGAIDSADRMNDLSKQTGFTVEAISGLKFAAEQSGTNLEDLVGGLRKFSKAAVEATTGGKAQAQAFRDIGVAVTDAAGQLKPTEQLLLDTAEAFAGFEDGAAKSATAQKLFGKSGAELIPFLNEGRTGIEALTKRAAELGIVLSAETAQAADDFNDKVAALKASTVGFITQAIGPLLPHLSEMVEAFTGATQGATDLSGATKVLQTGLKLVADFGLSVVHTFRAVGKDFGALAAAAVQFATGNFRQAADIIRARREDGEQETEAFQKALDKLWSDGTDKVVKTVEAADKKIRKTLILGGGTVDADALTEVVVTASKRQIGAMQALFDAYDDNTKTASERSIETFRRIESEINELAAAGFDPDVLAERYSEALDNVLTEVDVTAQKLGGKVKDTTDKLNEFQKQAARNTVDIIADTINAAFDGSIDEIPKKFANMLLQLAIQAQAAELGKKLFGDLDAKSGSSGGGFLGTIGSTLLGLFGGNRAAGGPVQAGKIYRVNENTPNSEWFAPSSNGAIIPAMTGGSVNNFNFSIDAPSGSISRQTEAQIAAAAARGIASANRRNN